VIAIRPELKSEFGPVELAARLEAARRLAGDKATKPGLGASGAEKAQKTERF
jgi:hypothetical protein